MCRMIAYLGEPEIQLSSLVLEPEHSLLVQSYAPKEMMSGVVNADGFGTGWYDPEVDEEPAVYRSVAPIWADRSFPSIAPKVRSSTVFAAVRSATPGLLGATDSETIFALLLDRLREAKVSPGDSGAPAEATAETILYVSTVCTKLGVHAALNIGVTDGRVMVFARYSTE